MFGSVIVYFGLVMSIAGLVLVVKPIRRNCLMEMALLLIAALCKL